MQEELQLRQLSPAGTVLPCTLNPGSKGPSPHSSLTHLPADASFRTFSPRIPLGGVTDVQKGDWFNKDLLYGTGNSAQCYVAVWRGGEFGESGYIHMYGQSFCCSPETITASLVGYTPVQNKKCFFFFKLVFFGEKIFRKYLFHHFDDVSLPYLLIHF